MNQMTKEQMRELISYYSGIEPTDEEVEDIMYYQRLKPDSDLSAIVSDYYSC